jgi:hypothetical protein
VLCDRCAILCIQVGVDLVEEVEGCGIAGLDCENEREGAETCFRKGEKKTMSVSDP